MLIPCILLAILVSFLAMDYLLLTIVFLTPLSIILEQSDFGAALAIPTEPLLFGVTILFVLRLFYEGNVDRSLLTHPITIAILLNLGWVFLTCITSTLPLVSWKFLISRLWLIIPFYFASLRLFQNKANMRKHIWLYLISFSAVIIYTLINHSLDNFSELAAHLSMVPFYNDHTSYGAIIAMYFPMLIYFAFSKQYSGTIRKCAFLLLAIFSVGLIFSYTRAAWLSMVIALGVMIMYLLRLRFLPVLAATSVILVLLFTYQSEIVINLQASKQKNTENRNFEQRIQSITNVTTDASNTERFNRWASAFRMFQLKPFFGWGPGTFQFQYGAHQISSEKTIISTNLGERGNAHSEYIGPLAETGLMGVLTFIGILCATLFTAGRFIYNSEDKKMKYFVMALSLGLITYFIHGTLNNFLDTDKASAPFWGFIAMIVVLDVERKNTKKV